MTDRRPFRAILLLGLTGVWALSAALTAPAAAGKLYRWVDEQGRVHYSDTIPPSEARQGRRELNDRGMTVRTVKRAKTPAEIAADKRRAALQAEEEHKRKEQAAQDRVLLETYSSVDMMVQARDSKIAAINGQIRLTRGNLKQLRNQLDELMGRAAALERTGKPVSKGLQRDIAASQEQIKRSEAFVASKEQEKDTIRAGFTRDIARYRELTGQAAKAADPAM